MIYITSDPNGDAGVGTVEYNGTSWQFSREVPPHLPAVVADAVSQYINSGKADGATFRVTVLEVESK